VLFLIVVFLVTVTVNTLFKLWNLLTITKFRVSIISSVMQSCDVFSYVNLSAALQQ